MRTSRRAASQEIGRFWHGLLAVGMCAALLAQTLLPTLHALDTARAEGRGIPVPQLSPAAPISAAEVARSSPQHDSATCPVCKSLLRTSRAALLPTPCGESCHHPVLLSRVAPVCAVSTVAQVGHPPRGPPARSFHLA